MVSRRQKSKATSADARHRATEVGEATVVPEGHATEDELPRDRSTRPTTEHKPHIFEGSPWPERRSSLQLDVTQYTLQSEAPAAFSTLHPGLKVPSYSPTPKHTGESSREEDDDDDDEEDDSTEDSDGSVLGMPDPILDDDDDQMQLSFGETIANEKLDHFKYARLQQRVNVDGLLPYVRAMYEHETQTSENFKRTMSEEMWVWRADDVLCTMYPAVLDALASATGNITQLYETDGKIKKALDKYKERAEVQPTVYVRALTLSASEGYRSLTKEEALLVAKQADAYASGRPEFEDDACTTDQMFDSSWTKEMSRKGNRLFLKTPEKKIDKTRQQQLQTFARVLETQCNNNKGEPMPIMHYVGFAMKGSDRLKQHRRGGKSSNWLLQCIKATMEAIGLEAYIGDYFVCLIPEEHSAKVAEIVVTRLARAYFYAGGLNVGVAGANTNSNGLARLDEKTHKAKWEDGLKYIRDSTIYTENKRAEIGKREVLQQADFEKKIESQKRRIKDVRVDLARMTENLRSDDARAVEASGDGWKKVFPEECAKIQAVRKYQKEKSATLAKVV